MNDSEQPRAPKVGDAVQFLGNLPQHYPNGGVIGSDPVAAIVTRVWGPTMVNLTIFPDNSSPLNVGSVPLVGADMPGGGYLWRWPS